MTTTQTVDIPTVLADIDARLAELGDPADVLNTPRAQAEFAAQQSTLRNRASVIRNQRDLLAEIEPQVDRFSRFVDLQREWLTASAEKIAALAPGDRSRYGWQLSVRWIERGLDFEHEALPARLPVEDLMRDAGYARADWLGPLPYCEARLRELQARAADARLRLQWVLADSV
jgi:hypothetical protein